MCFISINFEVNPLYTLKKKKLFIGIDGFNEEPLAFMESFHCSKDS